MTIAFRIYFLKSYHVIKDMWNSPFLPLHSTSFFLEKETVKMRPELWHNFSIDWENLVFDGERALKCFVRTCYGYKECCCIDWMC